MNSVRGGTTETPTPQVLGRYQIRAPIGAGSTGEVFRAHDPELDRTVAIKVLRSPFAGDLQLRKQLVREAKAISALSHHHICATYDIGCQDAVDYVVMEHLEGKTLADRLQEEPLQHWEVDMIVRSIAEALSHAHGRGVVHRDLKPANIFIVDDDQCVKVLDFGLSITHACTSAASQASSASPYIAPEQLEGKETDARTDIFSFGAVLFEMMTGKKAVKGQSVPIAVSMRLDRPDPNARPADESTLCPALACLIAKCLAPEPAARWQSIEDLREGWERVSVAPNLFGDEPPHFRTYPRSTHSSSATIRSLVFWLCFFLLGLVLMHPGC
jgi:serine/threonine protein kinase